MDGIRIDAGGDVGATRNDVQGNLIGTTYTGRAPLPNEGTGVHISDSTGNTVGGTEPGAGNVISGNAGHGVLMFSDADDNRVVGNWIGTNKTARRDLGNGGSGVAVIASDLNRIGDADEASPRNRIMHNDEDGVEITNGTGNSILRNSTTDNRNLAIDLGSDGSRPTTRTTSTPAPTTSRTAPRSKRPPPPRSSGISRPRRTRASGSSSTPATGQARAKA
jgi:hypothetical protein